MRINTKIIINPTPSEIYQKAFDWSEEEDPDFYVIEEVNKRKFLNKFNETKGFKEILYQKVKTIHGRRYQRVDMIKDKNKN